MRLLSERKKAELDEIKQPDSVLAPASAPK